MNVQPGAHPPQAPPGGYQLAAGDIRHPLDLPVLIATWAVALICLFLLGMYVSYGTYILIALGTGAVLNFFGAFRTLGSSVRVSPQQYPEVFQVAQEAAARLGMRPIPVYIFQSPFLRARTNWAVTGYSIQVSSALVDGMDLRELQAVIGQRLGAAKLGVGPMLLITGEGTSPVFNTMDSIRLPGILGIFSGLLSQPGKLLFSYWLRLRAHSYRRAGLVACQDIRSCLSAIVKELVGPDLFPYVNMPALLEQAQDLDRKFAAGLTEVLGGMQDAMYINQIRELLRWYRSPAYQQIAARQGKLGTGTLGYAAGGTGMLFGAVAHQAQARKGLYAAEWDRLPPPQMPPQGYRLAAREFRHPQEWLLLLASWGVGLAVAVLLGLINQAFIGPLFILIPIYFMQYFEMVRNFGTMVRVTPQQFPGLYNLLAEAAARLDMPMPPTFIKQEPIPNAYAAWVWPLPRFVVIHTGLMENYSPRELQFVIGHEYGHLKSAHTPLSLFFKVGPGGVVGQLMGPLSFLLKFWFSWWTRASETTADRAGLICTHDIRVTVAGILKLATGGKGTWRKVNVPALIGQLEQLDRAPLRQLAQSITEYDHPFALYRAREAIRFYKSAQYQSILARTGRPQTGTLQYAAGGTGVLLQAVAHQVQAARDAAFAQAPAAPAPHAAPAAQPAPAPGPQITACPRCGGAVRAGAKFCGHCGHRFV